MGKFFGMVIVLSIILLGLFGVVFGVTLILKFDFNNSIAIALFGILLESMVLLSATILFGVFTTPFMAVTFSVSLFLIGHLLSDLMYFAKQSDFAEFLAFAKFVSYVVPGLE